MGFFRENQTTNVWSCGLSIVILNYNCAVSSFVLYARNEIKQIELSLLTLASVSLMTGLLLGQLLFGLFGDTMGRRSSFYLSAAVMLFGGILSVFSGMIPLISTDDSTIIEFAVYRFIMGIGAGGMFPLVAAIARESTQERIANNQLAWIFGPIGSLGLIAAPLIIFIMTLINPDGGESLNFKWRLALAFGCLPIPILFVMNVEETYESSRPISLDSKGWWSEWWEAYDMFKREMSIAMSIPTLRMDLLGTSLSWFFSDILHYGNVLLMAKFFDDLIKKDAYDDDYSFSLRALSAMGVASAVCFWVGGMASIPALQVISALALQLQGFILSSSAFFLVAVSKKLLPSDWWMLTIVFYALTYFFNGYGPAPTTFLLPSFLFPVTIRSTANGIAAAVGKLGAICGILFATYTNIEISNLMACYGAVALMGAGSTLLLMMRHFHAVGEASAAKKNKQKGGGRGGKGASANGKRNAQQQLDLKSGLRGGQESNSKGQYISASSPRLLQLQKDYNSLHGDGNGNVSNYLTDDIDSTVGLIEEGEEEEEEDSYDPEHHLNSSSSGGSVGGGKNGHNNRRGHGGGYSYGSSNSSSNNTGTSSAPIIRQKKKEKNFSKVVLDMMSDSEDDDNKRGAAGTAAAAAETAETELDGESKA